MKGNNSGGFLRRHHARLTALNRKRVGYRFNAKGVFHDSFTKIFRSFVHCGAKKERELFAHSTRPVKEMCSGSGVKNVADKPEAIAGIDAALAHRIPMEDLFGLIESLPRKYRNAYCRYCFNAEKVSGADIANFNKARALLIKRMKDYLLNS